ncbi:hypothetical protein MIND_00676500 [Mycena indigotica]|uniref:Uncharacterized protein n=1 Tax=Mycena indigotica TaxID=2126181 RepID=A0A8H6SK61_9AGAR|nr:uncharacterized protein MIND_00676500 [Mycena indigotica]KAF7301123.1 hypothetical protein MIND_00676500 [Mycena indigotica]
MDPAYSKKKIIDLTDAELVALGFMGEDAPRDVAMIVEQVRGSPQRLGSITCYMVDILRRQAIGEIPRSLPPALPPPAMFNVSELDSGTTESLVAPPPELMWRSDKGTNPFITLSPGAESFHLPIKTVHGVYNVPLSYVWDNVAPKIIETMKARGIKYSSMSTARFSIEKEDGCDGPLGPVVIWIAVHPGTTDVESVRGATPDICRILADFNITDTVVEWYEGAITRLGG